MALIKCYECNGTVSDQAEFCPHCGAPLTDQPVELPVVEEEIIVSEANSVQETVPKEKKRGIKPLILIGIICAILICGFVAYLNGFLVKDISIVPTKIYICDGDSQELDLIVTPEYAKTGKTIWDSSNPSAVSIENGTITGRGEGESTISVKTKNGKTANCEVVSSNLISEWEWNCCYVNRVKSTNSAFKCYFSVDGNSCTFKDYLGNTYEGKWTYDETRDGVQVYSFYSQGIDWLITISDDSLTVSLEYSSDVVFFFDRK